MFDGFFHLRTKQEIEENLTANIVLSKFVNQLLKIEEKNCLQLEIVLPKPQSNYI